MTATLLVVTTGLLCQALGVFASEALTDIVQTTKGSVRGNILTTVGNSVDYSAFKGIPYAKPPTGYRRFQVYIGWRKTFFKIVFPRGKM